jgi:hypothetical protein
MDPWSVWVEDLHIRVKTHHAEPDTPDSVTSLDHTLTLDQAREFHEALDAAIKEAEAATNPHLANPS